MSDIRSDPDAPLPPAPEPWAGSEMPSHRDGPPFHMTEMIEAEPALAARVLQRLAEFNGAAWKLAAAIGRTAASRSPILVTGCGTSEHGALAVAEVLRESMRRSGLPWRLGEAGGPAAVQAFEAGLDDGLEVRTGLVIGISHEGGTWATNLALERAKAAGAVVALITCSDRSPGAAIADIVVTTGEQDQSWCHTVGYLSPILAAVSVGMHLGGEQVDPGTVTTLMAAGLDDQHVLVTEAIAERIAGVDRLIVTGSGADRPAARELVLKVEEGAHLPAAMRDLETILHGHLAGMDDRTGLILFLTDSTGADDRSARAVGVLAAAAEIGIIAGAILGADYADRIPTELTPAGRITLPGAPRLTHVVATLLGTAVPLQLLTERLARVRGINPDPIRRDDPVYLRAAEAAEAAG